MKILFLFTLVILTGVIITPAFAQIVDSVTVTTDKTSYEDDDTIFVIGEVREILSGYPVSLRVIQPNGNLATIVQVEVNSDKTFSTEITPNELWKSAGTYTIKAIYGTESRTDETAFTFGGYSGTSELENEITINTVSGSNTPGCEDTVDGCFTPKEASVALGGKVIFSNTDTAAHTFTAGTAELGPSGEFDSGIVMAGDSYEWTPTTEGEVPYTCLVHPWMAGIIFVGEGTYIPPQPESKITVSTDKSKYNTGEQITISGKVTKIIPGKLVTVSIYHEGNLRYIVQHSVTQDGKFSESFIAQGSLLGTNGVYKVTASYGSIANSSIEFFFNGDTNDGTDTIPPTSDDLPNEITINTTLGSNTPGCETDEGCFIPKEVSVAVGGKVIFSNTDTAAHTFTSGTPTDGPSGIFDSGLVVAGSSYEWTPTTEGEVPYFCMVHPWMVGTIFVGEGTYNPPQPEDNFDLQVTMGNSVYDLNVVATMNLSIDGTSTPQNVALEISDPSGTTVISRSFVVDSQGVPFEFKIDENFKTGTYKVVATTSNNGDTVTDTAYFKVKSQYNSFKITSVQVTDQQGNPSHLRAGEIGFIKVNLDASKSITTLVTVNLFDSDLTSIGIGSIKTTLSSGNSEIILSFMIPSDVAVGSSNIYVNAFSDWPSNGGIPLTGEVSVVEDIK